MKEQVLRHELIKRVLIKTVGADEPRVDYLNDSNGALLLEPSRTNSLLQSNQFDTTWNSNGVTETSGQAGYDGSNDAWLIERNAAFGNAAQNISQGGVQTFSVFAKAGTYDWAYLRYANASPLFYRGAFFNLSTGVVGTIDADVINAEIESVGDGWYRCSITYNQTISQVIVYPVASDGGQGDSGTGSIYIQDAQLEQGSYATSIIKTQGSAVTRVADSCTNGGNEQVINSTEGVLYAEINIPENIADNINISINDGTNDEYVKFIYLASTNVFRAQIEGSGNQAGVNTASLVLGSYSKLAVSYKSGEFKLYINGSQIGSTLTGHTLPTGLDTLSFDRGDGAAPFQGNVKDVRVYDTALTDQELAALTSVTNTPIIKTRVNK